ncbi:MAG: iron uptake porin [Cyanobacteriota bacterium]
MRSVSRFLAFASLLPTCFTFLPTTAAAAPGFNFEAIRLYAPTAEEHQVTSIGQFSDLQPSDWAYQALSNLVTRYGCVAGYPDGTFHGGKPMSRFEAAALLNSCLDRVTEVTDELKRLLVELEKELAALRGRVDGIEARVGELEAMEFSTTTRLMGVTAMYFNTASGPNKAVSSVIQSENGTIGAKQVEPEPLDASLVYQYSTILGLSTSFTGKDLLSIDLYTSNFQPYSSSLFGRTPNLTGTYSTRLSFDAPPYTERINVADLFYRFKVGNAITFKATAVGSEVSNELIGRSLPFQAAYPYIQSISRFGRFDPIYYQTLGRPGFSADWPIGRGFNVGGGYFGAFGGVLGGGPVPLPDGKITSASQAAIAQISWFPTPKTYTFGTALTYVKSTAPSFSAYGLSGYTGSQYSDQPFGTFYPPTPDGKPSQLALTPVGVNGDHLSLGFGWNVFENVYLTGDVGYVRATALNSSTPFSVGAGDTASIFEWNMALALGNFFGSGNVLTFVVGNPYRVVAHSNAAFPLENTPAWHLEMSYTYRVSDNINVVPGVIYVINPENNVNNDPIAVWSLKTVFFF